MRLVVHSNRPGIPLAEKLLVGVMVALIAYASWARGGTSSGYQPPMAFLAVAAWLVFFAVSPVAARLRSLLKDPVFYAAVLFLILLGIQWFNSGRTLLYDYNVHKWIYTPPRIDWLPSAIDSREALEMLLWFFPAFTIVLCIRHGLESRRSVRFFFIALLASACLLALFGIAQFLSGTSSIYWRYPLPCRFFASFGYQNHGAAFFFLSFCLAIGLAFHALFRGVGGLLRTSLLVLALLVTLAATHLSLSRGMVILSWTAIAVAGTYLGVFYLREVSPAVRINLVAGTIAITMTACYFIISTAGSKLDDEMRVFKERGLLGDFDIRWWQIQGATAIWKDHPWFGVGGWGYRHLSPIYVDRQHWAFTKEIGRGNVHNDIIQFLAEFGAIGLGLLILAVSVMLRESLRSRWRHSPGLMLFILVGIGSVFLYSMVDIPFRCPAIMFSWFAMLAGISRYQRLG